MELVFVLPDEPSRTFEAVDVSVTDFGVEYAAYQNYPYETADAVMNDLMGGLHEQGLFDKKRTLLLLGMTVESQYVRTRNSVTTSDVSYHRLFDVSPRTRGLVTIPTLLG